MIEESQVTEKWAREKKTYGSRDAIQAMIEIVREKFLLLPLDE